MDLVQSALLLLSAWLVAVAPLAALVLLRPARRGARLWVAALTALAALYFAVKLQELWRAGSAFLFGLEAQLHQVFGAAEFMPALISRSQSGTYFAINVAIAAIFALVAGIALALSRVQVPGLSEAGRAPWLRGAIVRWYCLVLAAWLATLMLLVEARALPPLAPIDPDQIYEATKQTVWAGLAVAMAVLGAAAVVIDTARAVTRDERAAADKTAPDLDAFVAHLRAHYEEHLLVPPRYRMPDRIAGAAPGAPPGPATKPQRNALFVGDLTHGHLERIADALETVQDGGGVSLVIAPADAVQRLWVALQATLARRGSDILARVLVLDASVPDSASRYTLIVASDDAVEALLLPNARANTALNLALTGLELLVVLEFHRLDAALLRLRLRGIATWLEGRTPRVLCQSLPRANLDAAVSNALAVLKDGEGFETVREGHVGTLASARTQVTVWSNTADALETLVKAELPPQARAQRFEATPLLAAAAARFDLAVSLPDGPGVERAPWDNTAVALEGQDQRRRDAIVALHAAPAVPNGEARHCTVIDDRGNLAESLYRLRLAGASASDSQILIILAAEYPLRDFLLHRLIFDREAGADLADVDARLLPIAPIADGGPTECAIVMADAFRGAGDTASLLSERRVTVAQSWIADAFSRLIAKDVARSFQLYPTKRGLEALFRLECGEAPALLRRTNERHETLFEVQDALPKAPRLALPVIAEDRREKFRVGAGDHGLIFATDSVVHHNGDSYRITRVSPQEQVQVRRETLNKRHGERTLFQRDYTIDFNAGIFARLVVDAYTSGDHATTLRRALLRGEVARRTVNRASVAALSRPIHDERDPNWVKVSNLEVRRHMSVLLLRFGLERQAFDGIATAQLRPGVAFALAVTLTDVLAALFPGLGERVAVMSPQAAPALAEARRSKAVADRFVAAMAPWLFNVREAPNLDDPPAGPNLTDKWIEAQFQEHEAAPAAADHVDLILVEDAFHDLGVLRAVMDTGRWSQQVIGVWHAYLGWVAAGATDHYSYGAKAPAGIFAFPEAHALLDRIIQPTERLDPPARQGIVARHGG